MVAGVGDGNMTTPALEALQRAAKAGADAAKPGKGKKKCPFDNQCITQQVWAEATRKLNEYLVTVTIKELCDRASKMGLEKELDHRFMYFI